MARRIRPREGAIPHSIEEEKTAIPSSLDTLPNIPPVEAVADAVEMPKKIGTEQIREATVTLNKYKQGKAHLEQKLIANEQFWKLRQWNAIDDGRNDFHPATPWLWTCIQSRYSDAMDSYPTCNLLAREEMDKAEAKKLSSIVPVIMEQNRFEDTYSDVAWYTLKQGGGVYGVFWDTTKHNGLGDISVKKVDFINLFWESGVTDIQQSENVFHTELVSNKLINQMYPQTEGKLGGKSITLAKYLYDDNIDTTDKSVVIDWYYHTNVNGKKVLQYVKYVGDIVLYATENETEVPTRTVINEMGIPMQIADGEAIASRGLYDHAQYPFVVQSLFPIEGSLCGYGLTDIGRDTQTQIDLLNKAVSDNALANARPRYFVRNDGALNEEEFTDLTRDIVHIEGSLDEHYIRPIEQRNLDGNYISFLDRKIDELKYCTSNQDSNNGIAPSGITAGSAISALQETAGKNARSSNKTFHRAYKEVVYQIIELIRQFYDVPRTFRITGAEGMEEYVSFSNENITPQKQMLAGMDLGIRKPEFDIEVSTEKQSPYKKMEINELAINFYNLGFFNPQMSDQALACLDMMDFNHKEDVINKIRQNGTMQEMLLQYQQLALMLAKKVDGNLANQIGQSILGQAGQTLIPSGDMIDLDKTGEHPFNEKAREQARASTQVD